jgi:hypothetical protein
VDGHPVHHQALRRRAQRRGDLLVDRLEEEGIQRGRRLAPFGLEGEDRPELVVADEEDPVGAEGQGSRRLRSELVGRVDDGLLAAIAAVR